MEVNEAIILAKKLALREQSPEEMEAITDFLKTASRAEAESFMEEYHAAIPVNGDFAKADQQLIDRLHGLDLHEKNHYPPTVHRVHFLKRSWFRYAAAAVLLITFVSVAYLWNIQKEKPSATLVKSNPVKTDIPAPTANRATLTLSGGQQILVDNVRDGRLAAEGQVSIEKTTDGRIVYSALSTTKELLYNTLVVPRGSQVASITLADGSRAWLNAESSLKYPVAFVGRERKVEITGEVYFEVSKDPKKKFIVSANGVSTEVLGTHFNVNAYANEDAVKVTLLEGSVKVSAGKSAITIKPGTQAESRNESVRLNTTVNLEQVMAWKNGQFDFDGADFAVVMRQLARWYDLEIRYEGGIPTREIRGSMGRDLNLSQVLRVLEKMQVKFRVEGKTLIVSP